MSQKEAHALVDPIVTAKFESIVGVNIRMRCMEDLQYVVILPSHLYLASGMTY